jgi:hypothetical protein
MKNPEENSQREIVAYCRAKHKKDFFIFSIPNELLMKLASFVPQKIRFMMISKMRAMGFLSGMPDLVLIGKGARVLFIELKSKDGKLSESQKRVFPLLEKFVGKIPVARSLNEALAAIKEKGFI